MQSTTNEARHSNMHFCAEKQNNRNFTGYINKIFLLCNTHYRHEINKFNLKTND